MMRRASLLSIDSTNGWNGNSKGTWIKRIRLDAELVRRGLTPTRSAARRAIEEGRVVVSGFGDLRPASLVATDAAIHLEEPQRFVSRGGDKLDGALARLGVVVAGRKWLDAGASTGGFTDRLLQGGADRVVAVDVGYGQLDWKLRNDGRVTVVERTNVRELGDRDLPFAPDGVVADLSFISLRTVLPSLVEAALPDAEFLVLVKPQFEVGKGNVGPGGVVDDPALWLKALEGVATAAALLGLGVVGACVAEPPGPAGNREFFLHLRKGQDSRMRSLEDAVAEAR
jgi:23S rRNA (cytidine1920-2'-O)/16S rRNA (cytidine1409-2'-O)-methyltransferase